jgi:hypothetical protein
LYFTITEPDLLEVTTTVNLISCNGSNDGSILLEGLGGTPNYTYFVNEIASSEQLYDNLSPGNYEVFAEDDNGCISSTSIITLSNPALLESTIVPTIESAPGALDGMAEITVTGGTSPYEVVWSDPNSQTGILAVYLSNGWYYANITDANGCSMVDSVFIHTLSLTDLTSADQIVFPNPAKDVITISNPATLAYIMYDMKGKLICEGNQLSIDVRALSSGAYMLKLVSDSGVHYSKVIIER